MAKIAFYSLLLILSFSCLSKKEEIPVGLYVGNMAPDFSGKTPSDSSISLNSLQGKLTLIDFWASWCMPCRYENRNLIQTVEKFSSTKFPGKKRKPSIGFTVLNISLDSDKQRWINAIKQDQLNWPYHISDLKGWGSEIGTLYKVNSIPSNFLVDAKGIIIARNLRGQKLDEFLNNYQLKDEK